ncbi:MAG: thrombospondin type 3 repeat-containing protein [Myxococcota bacterium]
MLGLSGVACGVVPGNVGDLPGDSAEASSTGEQPQDATETGNADETADGSSGATTEPAPSNCGPTGPTCIEDEDGDCVGIAEDNAPDVYNPDQGDMDDDDIADLVDPCPTIASIGDSDSDGLGNECDPCRRIAETYNIPEAAPFGYMRVRNIPSIADADGDGIGDACDNCIHVPNCQNYDENNPWLPGSEIAYDDPTQCQTDTDQNMVGDACEGLPPMPGAAAPVGLGPDDDFDQDGLTNVVDACPRSMLADAIACSTDEDCPFNRKCETAAGLCDHLDTDADGVGDACDTCPTVENPMQAADEFGAEDDDPDGDFIGSACEANAQCDIVTAPARVAFYPVAVEGQCCTVQYRGDIGFDPDGVPIRLDCGGEGPESCREVPLNAAFAPGVTALPPGCDEALAAAGLTVETHNDLNANDVGGVAELWQYSCRVPPSDQDFDGLPDRCDLCPLAFDPENTPYIDDGGKLWPNDGAYCNGAYSLDNICGQ